ncbi:MAG: hypothetical protein RLZZ416_625 [Candidatus Parcubacteria bacterium]|jgi:cold shock CspA family protein
MPGVDRCLTGSINGISQNGDYAFVNDAAAINGYRGDPPQSVFVHIRQLEGDRFHEGMKIDFNVRPGRNGKPEAYDVIKCSRH